MAPGAAANRLREYTAAVTRAERWRKSRRVVMSLVIRDWRRYANELCVHEEVVHGPVRLDAALAHEAGELGIVAHAMQESVEEDGLAVGVERTHGAGGEIQSARPSRCLRANSCLKMVVARS